MTMGMGVGMGTTIPRHGFVWPPGLPPCKLCQRGANDPSHVNPAQPDVGLPFRSMSADQAKPHLPGRNHAYTAASRTLLKNVTCQMCGQPMGSDFHPTGMPVGFIAAGTPGMAGSAPLAPAMAVEQAFVAEIGRKVVMLAPATTGFGPEALPAQVASVFQAQSSQRTANLWVAGRYVEADRPNRNAAFWSTADLEIGQPSVTHGPINWLHEEKHVIGAIAASELVRPERQAAGDGLANHIVALGAVWPWLYPEEARTIARASDQGKLYFCVDQETELLTSNGWRSHADLAVGDAILTLNPRSGLSEWLPNEHVFRYQVDTQMVSMEGQQHSSLTTPNHRWLVRQRRGAALYRSEWRETQDLSSSSYIPRAVAQMHEVPVKYRDEFVELLAWFWTEGTVTKSGRVTIYQSIKQNPAYVSRIHAALYRLLGDPAKARAGGAWYVSRVGDMAHFHLTKAASEIFLDAAPGKVVRPEIFVELTPSQLRLFIETSIDGDGSRATSDGQVCITQKNLEGLRSLEIACALAGIPTTTKPVVMRGFGKVVDAWRTCLVRRSDQIAPKRLAAMGNGFTILEVPYEGVVWCPSTPNGTFLARRNGTVYWTGNSMECVSNEVACLSDGCSNLMTYRAYMTEKASRCEHMKDGQPRRFVDPVFEGAGIIVPPVRPGWARADARVLMPQAAEYVQAQAAAFEGLDATQAETLVATLIATTD